MLDLSWKLDHVGLVVKDLDQAIDHYQRLFGFSLLEKEVLNEQKIKLAFLSLENSLIELLSPTEKNSTLENFLSKRGEGMHHICYQVPSVSSELKRLANLGVNLIDKTPRKGSQGMHIAFIHPQSVFGVLTELCGGY